MVGVREAQVEPAQGEHLVVRIRLGAADRPGDLRAELLVSLPGDGREQGEVDCLPASADSVYEPWPQ
ncbi:hypothetical protein GCM10027186_08470 [Micromonospora schwarzwaldensis]